MNDSPVFILGLSAFFHDSAACLIRDGQVVAAVEEERFSRKKHDPGFPFCAIAYCLREAGISSSQLQAIVFYEKPFIKFDRIIETIMARVPWGFEPFEQAVPSWLKDKIWIKSLIAEQLKFNGPVLFSTHHRSHAASAFYPSPFEESAFLTVDGVGEWDTTSFGYGELNKLHTLKSLSFPHSLGLLYSAFTQYAGFKINSGEYKLMGLAPYGRPKYRDVIFKELIDIKEDGSFRLNMKYFGYVDSLRMINRRFEELFGGPARQPESMLTGKDMDIAASIQSVLEDVLLKMAVHIHKVTGKENLCLAGGVALNAVANGQLLRKGPFKRVWIQPASGDAGGALGAALLIWHEYFGNSRVPSREDAAFSPFLGPSYTDEEMEEFLIKENIPYRRLSYSQIPDVVARLISEKKVVGWFQGRCEFGPRALGARCILADARDPSMRNVLNEKIKHRESFRPFAPAVLHEHAGDWFEIDRASPYMLLTAPVRAEKAKLIPAVTHSDLSARLQTVQRDSHALFYELIRSFYQHTGCPVVINTSFNVRGEPLVTSPMEAVQCFFNTDMDCLALGCFLIDKMDQPPKERHVPAFELD